MNDAGVLVTGGNSGIGFECARALAKAGRHVIIASRDRRTSDDAVGRIAARSLKPQRPGMFFSTARNSR